MTRLEEQVYQAITKSDRPQHWRDFLKLFPNGVYADEVVLDPVLIVTLFKACYCVCCIGILDTSDYDDCPVQTCLYHFNLKVWHHSSLYSCLLAAYIANKVSPKMVTHIRQINPSKISADCSMSHVPLPMVVGSYGTSIHVKSPGHVLVAGGCV